MITGYDPNNRFGKHIVAVTFKKWQYEKTVSVEVSGNCKGISMLSHAYEDACMEAAENGMILVAPDGAKLGCEAGGSETDWENCIVGAKIITFEPEIKK